MRFILSVILIALLSFIVAVFTSLPWWTIAIISFGIALLLHQGMGRSFLAGFLAIFILWGIMAFWIDIKNDGLLSGRIAELFPLGGSGILLVLLSATVGGLVAGFAALSGAALLPRKRIRRFY